MDADLTVQANPRKKHPASLVIRVKVPKGFASLAPTPHRPKERVIFRAKSRARTAAIVADAAIEGTQFTPSELWAIVEGTTVGGRPVQAQHRVRSIRDEYDSMVRKAAGGEELPALIAQGGATVLPDSSIASPFVRAFEMAARAIADGVAPTEARLSANALLLRNGIDSVALRVSDRQRHEDAVRALRTSGDASQFFKLMLDRYSEDD